MTQTDLSAIRILVVEDNLLQRRILTRILQAANAREVRQAADGGEALAILETFLPDVILTNRQMQPMDGITFARNVRASEQRPFQAVPIIMLSLNDELNLKKIARSVGINAFLIKPVSPDALCQCILQLTRNPLPFVRSPDYIGPDRRRADVPFSGPDRRRTRP
jgi:two-component system, chemotaxis family, chemotaxis protein CheY